MRGLGEILSATLNSVGRTLSLDSATTFFFCSSDGRGTPRRSRATSTCHLPMSGGLYSSERCCRSRVGATGSGGFMIALLLYCLLYYLAVIGVVVMPIIAIIMIAVATPRPCVMVVSVPDWLTFYHYYHTPIH